jgi:phage gp46-like protein
MDARLVYGPDGVDVDVVAGDLAVDEGLLTAVVISVLSDSRAPADDGRPLLEQDLRGYWGEAPGDVYGSLLWTVTRQKATAQTASRARETVEASLAWMVAQGVARSVVVDASYRAPGVLQLDVTLTRGTARRWASLWDATAAAAFAAQGVLLQVHLA